MPDLGALFSDANVSSLEATRSALLPHTLEYAATRIPFYRELWQDRWREESGRSRSFPGSRC